MFFSLVFHNHQPVGQLPWAFEDAWRDSYQPFLDVLAAHPRVKVALHYTGPLLDWLQKNKPQTVAQIRDLVTRGQVEILSGGFYEPILAIWPRADQIAQMQKLNARVREVFGANPRGMWLAERVWEAQLAPTIRTADLNYTFVDGTVFEAANIAEHESFDAFSVAFPDDIEYSNSQKLAIFPINQPLRHIIPWRAGEETLQYLRDVHAQNPQAMVVFADDGEKFGAWPGTFDFVFTRGWLDDFFTLLESNSAWLQTVTPGEFLSTRNANFVAEKPFASAETLSAKSEIEYSKSGEKFAGDLREIALPAGSYSEMQAWSRGNWRNFLARYRESRDIFEEVLRVREIVERAAIPNEMARDNLLQAQSNDPLWHGVFGGLYLRHLRQALYARAIEAQILAEGNAPFVRVSREENGDFILENEQIKLGVREIGGHIFNWTSKASRHNALSTLRRYREDYHANAEANRENAPDFDKFFAPEDWYARGALLDHFFGDDATVENFARSQFPEMGDFVSEKWQIESGCDDVSAWLILRRDGGVWQNGVHQSLSICKRLTLRLSSCDVEIEYSIINNSAEKLELWWANEWNLAMSGVDSPTRHYHAANHKLKLRLDQSGEFMHVSNPIAADSWLQLQAEWNFAPAVALWHVPIWSVSQKEGGEIERAHQSSAFVFQRNLSLEPHIEYSISFSASLNSSREL